MAKHISITGAVHGVGFRPFVYGLATRLSLRGWVRKTSAGVEIFVEGSPSNVENFIRCLRDEKPSLARIDSMEIHAQEGHNGYQAFDILPSVDQNNLLEQLPVDLAICPECESELFDPRSRRYLYPFISCTHCGPRFSIIKKYPYDRHNTTMSEFGMCEQCSREYQDAEDRRFHAHPIACPDCGPFVALRELHTQFPYASLKISSIECRTSAVLKARRLLREGYILGIKGLGGFHLACDASNSLSVEELRDRKGHVGKPFALMAANMDVVQSICRLRPGEEELLTGREKPIVLLEKNQNEKTYSVSRWVAPGLDTLGVMLPYSPLHHLLLNQTDLLLGTEPSPPLLVMTSGNLADEPIATDDEDALLRLSTLVDAFILHNREIHMRCDDSVVRVDHGFPKTEEEASLRPATIFLRRSRGYAPYGLSLPLEVRPTLAVGSEWNNAFCLANGRHAFLSHRIGSMENVQTYESFEQSVEHLSRVLGIRPEIIAHDQYPDYFSTQYVRQSSLNAGRLGVQHQHAHVASCMADNGLEDRRLIGLAFDGTGYGSDGAFWGGEVLLASYSDFDRFAHLEYLPLPGGDTAIRSPWQIACGYAHALGLEIDDLPFLQQVDKHVHENLIKKTDEAPNPSFGSSMLCLMEAVAGLIGIRRDDTYEAQAVLEMEALARPFVHSVTGYPFEIETTGAGTLIRLKELLSAVIRDVRSRRSFEMIAARFHRTIENIAVDVCMRARQSTGLNEVALCGSVWQYMILLDLVRKSLKREGFTVYFHRQVPVDDGGLALGQAIVANHSAGGQKDPIAAGSVPLSKVKRLP